MPACAICLKPQERRLLIEGDLSAGLTPRVIAMRYHLPMHAIEVHAQVCMREISAIDTVSARVNIAHERPMASCEVCAQRPLIRWKQVWQDAKDDNTERARMVAWLNDQLQRDDMGLL